MMPRQSFYALLAALFLVGTVAASAQAATRHHHHAHHAHAMSSRRGTRTAQDNSADRLNAQSLERSRSQSGAMQAPMAPMSGMSQ